MSRGETRLSHDNRTTNSRLKTEVSDLAYGEVTPLE